MAVTTVDPRNVNDDETYYLINRAKGIVIYHDTRTHIENGDFYKWEGMGDPDGNDIAAVPGSVVKHRNFQRALARGIFEFRSDSEFYDRVTAVATSDWEDDSGIVSDIDRSANESFVLTDCLGPAPKGSGLEHCTEMVGVRSGEQASKPPLCDRHQRYANFFSYEDGTWSRIPT